jgi:hypothetical protein
VHLLDDFRESSYHIFKASYPFNGYLAGSAAFEQAQLLVKKAEGLFAAAESMGGNPNRVSEMWGVFKSICVHNTLHN